MGVGYTPIHTMQASNGTSTAISRGDRSASVAFTLLSSGLKITRCSAGSRYIAATMTPAVAIVAATGYVRNVPSSTRNSPTNPFVAGSPIEDSETIVSTAASSGTTFAMPPNASMRREWRRSYSMPARKNSAPVEMPWLIITRSAPCTLWSVRAQMPSITKPRCATDEYAISFLKSGWTSATSAPHDVGIRVYGNDNAHVTRRTMETTATIVINMTSQPNNAYMKNFMAANRQRSAPHTPMTKYMAMTINSHIP